MLAHPARVSEKGNHLTSALQHRRLHESNLAMFSLTATTAQDQHQFEQPQTSRLQKIQAQARFSHVSLSGPHLATSRFVCPPSLVVIILPPLLPMGRVPYRRSHPIHEPASPFRQAVPELTLSSTSIQAPHPVAKISHYSRSSPGLGPISMYLHI